MWRCLECFAQAGSIGFGCFGLAGHCLKSLLSKIGERMYEDALRNQRLGCDEQQHGGADHRKESGCGGIGGFGVDEVKHG